MNESVNYTEVNGQGMSLNEPNKIVWPTPLCSTKEALSSLDFMTSASQTPNFTSHPKPDNLYCHAQITTLGHFDFCEQLV